VRVCAWMRACVHGRMCAYVRMRSWGVDVPHVDAECVYAQIEGMVVFFIYFYFYGVGRVGRRGKGRTWPGPIMVPFQLDMRISSLSSRP
jgi:hypothetical protein